MNDMVLDKDEIYMMMYDMSSTLFKATIVVKNDIALYRRKWKD